MTEVTSELQETRSRPRIDPVLWILVAIIWLGVFYSLLGSTPVRFPDSPGYVGDPAQLHGYLSFTGDAVRAWPTVLLFWAVESDFQRIALQSFLYAAAWSGLIVIWFQKRPRTLVLTAGSLVTALALTPLSLQWNLAILAESTTISLAIGGIAATSQSVRLS